MAQLTVQQAFEQAIQHHRAGRRQQAEQIYRQILAQQPDHAVALHYLGMMAHQAGHNEIAVELLRRAVAMRPGFPEACCDLGKVLSDQGRIDEAIAACRAAIAMKPDFAHAHCNLGNVLRDKGEIDQAIAACRQAIALRPNFPEAYNNLSNALRDKGELDEAIIAGRAAVALLPASAEVHNNLSNALRDKGQLDEAIAGYRRAIALRPDYPEAHGNLGNVLREKGEIDEAIVACRRAIALRPTDADAYGNLGAALRDKRQSGEAIAAFRQAIALRPTDSKAHNNLGVLLTEARQVDEAVAAYRAAITFQPDNAEAHQNLGLTLLTRGDFEEGWKEFEWRWKYKGFPSPQRNFPQPQWDGDSLVDRTILLHAEQGFGDTLQFIRYLPLAAGRGGTVIVECQPELHRLLQPMSGTCQIVATGQPLPAFDVHCPLLSLPRAFGTTSATIPQPGPYLHADPQEAGRWRERLAHYASALRIGLVWAGRPTHKNDCNRSMRLADLEPLAHVPGVQLFSLQKGGAAAQLATAPAPMELVDWTQELNDFADTAALIANLDLVISVDTAVVHLAAAMGKPTWLLLSTIPDFRWQFDREDSPWYPSIRIFRQARAGEWDDVVARIASALREELDHR